ncbi:MAG: undecaprenyl-diphosphate phosphatase [Acidobacteria bacterium]|nr:undecaprenyl-diphosphate phosphatase [Acidobacteriota bacterium]
MTLWQAIVLAIVQGATEFLPISSTAHLVLVPWLLGWPDPGLTYDVALHAGTLVALLVYFAPTWAALAVSLFTGRASELAVLGGIENPRRLLSLLAAATIPGALVGYFLESYAETWFRTPRLVAAALMLVALVMWIADQMPGLTKKLNEIGWGDSLTVGTAQALAVVPGVSRAGITIAAGMFRGLERETAARFSFMLATPIIAGAAVQKFAEISVFGLPEGVSQVELAVGFLVSAATGFAAIAFLLRYLRQRTLKIFVAYRVVLGIIILVFELLQAR